MNLFGNKEGSGRSKARKISKFRRLSNIFVKISPLGKVFQEPVRFVRIKRDHFC